ncbi:MAG: hypothetical protein K8R59_03605 [Thermoanaerobaculales bacterium]|nr:hypothetical protein [Thermoanaerobaculales bacterium]
MYPSNNSLGSVVIFVSIICCVGLTLAAQTVEPPYFGPPGMHVNTLSGLVNTDGVPGASAGDSPAYFGWLETGELINAVNPWYACAQNPEAFVIETYMGGQRQGIYDSFDNPAFSRGFYFDNYDGNGDPVGGTYWSEVGDFGTATLEKSDPHQGQYDLIRLQSGGAGRQMDTVLPLVMHQGGGVDFIGVGNIASLGVIGPCGNANANTDIMIPLGRNNGMPAIILDLEGDGTPTPGFLASAPLQGRQVLQAAIPTLSTGGVAVLVLSLLAIGLMILRRSGGTFSV